MELFVFIFFDSLLGSLSEDNLSGTWRPVSCSHVNSRLACSQSDFDASCAGRPLTTASSSARSRTILRVTGPWLAEFFIRASCFCRFVFTRYGREIHGSFLPACRLPGRLGTFDPARLPRLLRRAAARFRCAPRHPRLHRSEEHTSELQSRQ